MPARLAILSCGLLLLAACRSPSSNGEVPSPTTTASPATTTSAPCLHKLIHIKASVDTAGPVELYLPVVDRLLPVPAQSAILIRGRVESYQRFLADDGVLDLIVNVAVPTEPGGEATGELREEGRLVAEVRGPVACLP